MIKKDFKINNAPSPVGSYPHSKKVGDFLFLSGIGSRNIKDLVEFESILSKSETFRPKMENKLRDKIISNWNSAIKQTMGMSFE